MLSLPVGSRRVAVALLASLVLVLSLLAAASPRSAAGSPVRAVPLARLVSHQHWQSPPTTADCVASAGVPCYRPAQLQRAYDLMPLYRRGLDGAGSTIAIVDSFGSPTARADLRHFDRDFGLPDPPHFRIIQPAGPVPAFDPNDADMTGWAEETSLDVQWAHAIAPKANLLLVETPVSETEGVQGFPEIVKAENYVIRHGLADVITQSFGATEETFPSVRALLRLRSAYENAARHHVTVLAGSGDSGATNYDLNGDLYTHRVIEWPSADPLVTSIGGTQLHLDAVGDRTQPDNVWNDTALFGGPFAAGGGRSHVFSRPRYQDGVASVVHAHRGTPDISMSAAFDGAVLVYLGFTGVGVTPGYYPGDGTSESSPEFAGIVAIATQRAHHRLGMLNPRLYALNGRRSAGLVDVRRGANTVSFTHDGATVTVPGFHAHRGYDLGSGWGTVDAARLTAALARR